MIEKLCQEKFEKFSAINKMKIYQNIYKRNWLGEISAYVNGSISKNRTNKGEEDIHFAQYGTSLKVYNLKSLLLELKNYDTISFDIFDTILFRKVKKPIDVFALIEAETGITSFSKNRELAEIRAREKKYRQKNTYEVNLKEIYEMLPNEYRKDYLLNMELLIEKENCYLNPLIHRIIKDLRDLNKTIIAISDMYLTSEQIRRLVTFDDFRFTEPIYVSCEIGESKNNSNIFNCIKSPKNGMKFNNMIHIGDNFHSDVLMCAKNKITSLHYVR